MYTSMYDPNLWDSMPPANVRGGQSRALKARRDLLGRFMPDDPASITTWNLDEDHGRAGGLSLLEKRGREYFQQLAKRRWSNGKR